MARCGNAASSVVGRFLQQMTGVSACPFPTAALERPVEPEAPAPPPADLSTIDRVKGVLETQRKMLLVTALEAALATVFEESELCIEFAPDARHHRDTLSKPENVKFVREACRDVTGQEIGIRIIIKDPKAEGEPLSRDDEARLEKQRLREAAENNPIVQQMLKTFRGEIVDVRREGER